MVSCLPRSADLHMAQLMPLQLTASCFSEIQIGFTFLVLAHPGSPRKRAVKRLCVCVVIQLAPTVVQQLTRFRLSSASCSPSVVAELLVNDYRAS